LADCADHASSHRNLCVLKRVGTVKHTNPGDQEVVADALLRVQTLSHQERGDPNKKHSGEAPELVSPS
jgi:hypothetical protein